MDRQIDKQLKRPTKLFVQKPHCRRAPFRTGDLFCKNSNETETQLLTINYTSFSFHNTNNSYSNCVYFFLLLLLGTLSSGQLQIATYRVLQNLQHLSESPGLWVCGYFTQMTQNPCHFRGLMRQNSKSLEKFFLKAHYFCVYVDCVTRGGWRRLTRVSFEISDKCESLRPPPLFCIFCITTLFDFKDALLPE